MSENEPKLEEIIKSLGVSKDEKTDFFRAVERQSKDTENLADQENRAIIKMRGLWSTWVLIFIGIIVAFDIILVSFYGFGIWNFKDSNVVVIVITENFLKIVGLGLLITHSLFKKIF